MTARSRNHLTAWLGFIAMWSVVLAPLVSQLVVSARLHDPGNTPLCSAMPVSGRAVHSGPADVLAACGYCDLLADHAAPPAVPPSRPLLVLLLIGAVATTLSLRHTPPGRFPAGRPRAPPVLRFSNP
ncbi:DUF2946 domain-containing protein [Burkholderia perseverans]|uniref:DUF2946 domain-containing protein n=1 Tax=Burkholderia perseverans TaxID=2615214 RepID=UPI001FEDBE14|nr:DUF2946 domain-containing protein [Burkholderia perseverans]